MLVSKINFTSESNLLNKINKPVELKPQATEPKMQSKDNKVRNLSIGLGSAAILLSLGVLGRSGKLGKGMQKFLGGVKKTVPEVIETAETKADEIVQEILPAPKKPVVQEVIADAAKINAGLDRTIPKLECPVKTEIPDIKPLADEFRFMDVSGIEDNYSKITLPNGNIREIFLTSDGKRVARAFDKNANGERVLEIQYINGEFLEIRNGNEIFNFRGDELNRYAITKNGNIYSYNPDGALTYVCECKEGGRVTRNICFEEGTDNVRNILYIDPDTNKMIKQDIFNNGEIVDEVFYSA